jgi:hypothetical protein
LIFVVKLYTSGSPIETPAIAAILAETLVWLQNSNVAGAGEGRDCIAQPGEEGT